jgi:exodeoxyribonuclease VII small subunit
MAKESTPEPTLNFEAALEELEQLVERMETGELTLEESLKAFERGVVLTRDCQKALKDAELRVQALTETDEGLALEDVDADEFEHDDDV